MGSEFLNEVVKGGTKECSGVKLLSQLILRQKFERSMCVSVRYFLHHSQTINSGLLVEYLTVKRLAIAAGLNINGHTSHDVSPFLYTFCVASPVPTQ